jgi:hypothetical protein
MSLADGSASVASRLSSMGGWRHCSLSTSWSVDGPTSIAMSPVDGSASVASRLSSMEGWRHYLNYRRSLIKVAEDYLPLVCPQPMTPRPSLHVYHPREAEGTALRPDLGRIIAPHQSVCLQSMAPRPSLHVYHPWKAGGTSSIIAQVVDKGSGGLPTSG